MITTFQPVTILCENGYGEISIFSYEEKQTQGSICDLCEGLSNSGYEPVKIQVDESQETLHVAWWK